MECIRYRGIWSVSITVEYGGGGAEGQQQLVAAGAAGRRGVQLRGVPADDGDEHQPQQPLGGLQQTVPPARQRTEQHLLQTEGTAWTAGQVPESGAQHIYGQ